MARSEAQIRAEKKHLEKTKSYHIKFNIYTDADIIAAIESQKNKNGSELIIEVNFELFFGVWRRRWDSNPRASFH